MRVQWSCRDELAADDILDYFSAFGVIEELDWLEDGDDIAYLYGGTQIVGSYEDGHPWDDGIYGGGWK